MNKKTRFEVVTITHKTNRDRFTHVWAMIEDNEIVSLSDASGKLLKMTSRDTVIFKDEEYFFYPDLLLKHPQ